MLDRARRDFMTYISILGFVGMSGGLFGSSSLEAKDYQPESIGHTRFDDDFDPDGWL